jgi:phosphate:Na+ symporter
MSIFTIFSNLIGGIGLFLLGMILMTEGLKSLAGNALKSWLQRFTGSPSKALLTGMSLTALVQSSSVTTMATIGFVSAGLLNFSSSIGVILGANLGSTSTGWLVSLLGLKFSIVDFVMPLIGIGALMRLFSKHRIANLGLAIAGFSIIFVGIQTLQTGMSGVAERFDLSQYSSSGIQARFILVLIGTLITILMQSSGAAVATTLTALAAGTISMEQAAALVIGQNLGTTFTAVIAAIGASIPAKRTALIHVLFNFGTGLIAFFLLPLFIYALDSVTDRWLGADHALSLAAFHTGFNVLGILIFMPLSRQLAWVAETLIAENKPSLTRQLNAGLIAIPSLAIDTAKQIIQTCILITLQNAASRLRGEKSDIPLKFLKEVQSANEEVAAFINKLPSAAGEELTRLNDLLHALDHCNQCAVEAMNPDILEARLRVPELHRRSDYLANLFLLGAQALSDEMPPYPSDIAEQLSHATQYSADARPAILQSTLSKQLDLSDALYGLNAQRRLESLTLHAVRALYYLERLNLSKKEIRDTSPPLDTAGHETAFKHS